MNITTMMLVALAFCAADAQLRIWTDNTGQHKTEAELVGLAGNAVRLKKLDGTIVSVPVRRLSGADCRFVIRGLPQDIMKPVQRYVDHCRRRIDEQRRRILLAEAGQINRHQKTPVVESASKIVFGNRTVKRRTIDQLRMTLADMEDALRKMIRNPQSGFPAMGHVLLRPPGITTKGPNIGMVGRLPGRVRREVARAKRRWIEELPAVIQIIDDENMLMRAIWTHEYGNSVSAAGPIGVSRVAGHLQRSLSNIQPVYVELWVKGLPTAALADDAPCDLHEVFHITGKRTYVAGIGVVRTVLIIEPIDLSPYMNLAACAAEHN